MNFLLIFLTGLTTGGITCMAMQGGLLASVIANQKKNQIENNEEPSTSKFQDLPPTLAFLIAKLISHTLLGFILGIIGSSFQMSANVQIGFQVIAAIFMFATAMNLLQIHPIFRYVVIQPPKFISKFIKNTKKSDSFFAPVLMGFLTVLIPCGVTQSMELQAINSGSPIVGALTMFFFVLGTMPLFTILGLTAAKLTSSLYHRFTQVAAILLILMSAYSLNGVLVVINSPLSVQSITTFVNDVFFYSPSTNPTPVTQNSNEVQKITINIQNNGYEPDYLKVNRNQPVELTLASRETYSCALSFVLKEFDIKTFLGPNDNQTFTFTPTQPGKYRFNCSMGMYTGILEVI